MRKGKGDEARKLSVQQTDVLYGRRWFDFEDFIYSAHELMPILVHKLTEVEKEVRAFLEEKPLGAGLVA